MKIRCLVLLSILLASCGSKDEGPPPEPIVIYAPDTQSVALATLFADFTADTGIRISAKWGPSEGITDGVINKTGVPADILMTDNIADIWRAADEGALRPIQGEALESLSASLRDSDRYWFAYQVSVHGVLRTSDEIAQVSGLDELVEQALSSKVCLSSASLAENRALLAMTISRSGVRDTERLFRRIAGRQAVPPFEKKSELAEAVRDGRCDYGVATDSASLSGLPFDALAPITYTGDGVGIGRHARNPGGALDFANWLITERIGAKMAQEDWPPISTAGYRDEEARLLAERARYH